MHVQEMIRSHPHVRGVANDALLDCIEHCYDCAQTCVACADACLGEKAVADLTQCIRLNLDCADVCAASGTIGSRRTGSNEELIAQQLRTCALACRVCADECRKHAKRHEHCRICADACEQCFDACERAIASLTKQAH